MSRGLYIHFPFCTKKCNYCDFYSIANMSHCEEYLDALCREIRKNEGQSLDTVYLGGGTPSLMTPNQLKRVLDSVSDTFFVMENAEITLEANPMTLCESDKLSEFGKLGVNRLSLGVQSFSDIELKALGRGHTSAEAVDTVKRAKEAFDNVSLDLMFGIPHQTVGSFSKTLDTAIALGVEHISVYALGIEDKTVFGVKQKRGENLFLPSEDEEYQMYFTACEKLKNAGFEHYEISNFATDKHRSRHNMKYWHAEEYIGVGASAHSYYNGERYSTPADVKSFINGAEKLDAYTNTKLDRAEELVFLSLRLSDGLNIDRLEKEYSATVSDNFYSEVKALSDQGYCRLDGSILSLTEKGFFVSNSIIVKLLENIKI